MRSHRPRFWADRPATAGPTTASRGTAATGRGAAERRPTRAPVHGVALGGGAILLVPRPVTDTDRADIAAAAAPLLEPARVPWT